MIDTLYLNDRASFEAFSYFMNNLRDFLKQNNLELKRDERQSGKPLKIYDHDEVRIRYDQ